ncbi:MAG: GTPase Era [Methyloligella sp.]|nr:MAG: GTPase Era [Methyloligella sp.]
MTPSDEDPAEVTAMDPEQKTDFSTKCGFVALIGAPNAGKSTLTNRLVGTKVSIVTRKVQTTRARIRGIAIFDETQIVFVDTPGIFAPKRRLDRAMVDAAWGGAADADLVVLLVDAQRGITEDVANILKKLKDTKYTLALAINKMDLVRREDLLKLTKDLTADVKFDEVLYISAEKGQGTGELVDYLKTRLPLSPWLYPEDQLTDAPMRHTAAEITREKLFLRLHDELPYATTVETIDWKVKKDKSVRVEQVIFVERDSQKKIVLGKNGDAVKSISMSSRKELSEILGVPVHLFLFVKVRERWGDDPARFREMGLDYTK